MALILDGNGTMTVGNGDITGLATGALPSTVIGAGAVLQVVQAVTTTQTSTTSNSFTDATGLSVSITPTSASNKVLILSSVQYQIFRSAIEATGSLQIVRNSTAVFSQFNNSLAMEAGVSTGSRIYFNGQWAGVYLDSPATTSATTYKIQLRGDSATSFTVNAQTNNQSSIVVMEIAA